MRKHLALKHRQGLADGDGDNDASNKEREVDSACDEKGKKTVVIENIRNRDVESRNAGLGCC